jgi:hypothetical protein
VRNGTAAAAGRPVRGPSRRGGEGGEPVDPAPGRILRYRAGACQPREGGVDWKPRAYAPHPCLLGSTACCSTAG